MASVFSERRREEGKNGWINRGRMVDGWMGDGRMDGSRINECWMDGWREEGRGRMDGWMDDGWMDDGWVGGWLGR